MKMPDLRKLALAGIATLLPATVIANDLFTGDVNTDGAASTDGIRNSKKSNFRKSSVSLQAQSDQLLLSQANGFDSKLDLLTTNDFDRLFEKSPDFSRQLGNIDKELSQLDRLKQENPIAYQKALNILLHQLKIRQLSAIPVGMHPDRD